MSYVKNNLGPGEEVVYQGQTHWAIGLPWFVLGAFFLPGGADGAAIATVFFLVGALRIVLARLMYEYAITNRRVVMKRGIVFRDTVELNLGKVESASIKQGILGRILGYGILIVRGSGGTSGTYRYLARPLEFRRVLQETAHDAATPQGAVAPSR